MAFYDRLKESRIKAGLTQEQLAEKLGVAKSTLSGYESGNREPSVATVAKALEILNIDANYLYQDESTNLTELVVSLDEKDIIKKYRNLDDHGKEVVDFLLEKEYERCIDSAQKPAKVETQEPPIDFVEQKIFSEVARQFEERKRKKQRTERNDAG